MSVWIAGAALLLSGYAVVSGEIRAHRVTHRRRSLGPADDLREALTALRTAFTEIANTGKTKPFFTDPDRNHIGERARDLADRVTDQELITELRGAAIAWETCFGLAPPKRGARMVFPGAGPDPVYSRQDSEDQVARDKQGEVAQVGLDSCRSAIDRVNQLDRQ